VRATRCFNNPKSFSFCFSSLLYNSLTPPYSSSSSPNHDTFEKLDSTTSVINSSAHSLSKHSIMPNVLILGGSGYLGFALGQSLLRSGNYAVWGFVRTAEKAQKLAAAEITPIVGDASDLSAVTALIASAPIDIVVDASSAYEQAGAILSAVIAASKTRLEALAKDKSLHAPKLGFVYTSGSWVHGSPSGPVNDLAPIGTTLSKGTPAKAVGWRGGHEQAILAARDVLDVAIIRPCEIYGKTSWLWGTWWGALLAASKSGSTEAIKVPAGPEARPAIIHLDDVVSGFHAAIDKIDGQLGNWPVFDLVGETVSVTEIMEGAKEALGVKAPLEYAGTQGNAFYEAMGLRTFQDASRARTVLGWEAKRRAFILKLPVYVEAWKASQESK
jgi:nucleoside-diphosphate-sugar epimerase